jgi:predicted enzyme related to lactoylglutathione lyase
MNLEIQHIEVHVSSLENAKDFYVTKLGLNIIEETPTLNQFSVKAGGVRVSIFAGYQKNIDANENITSTHIIFKTDDIVKVKNDLINKGVQLKGDIFEAPGFLKCITTADPDGNIIEIAEYLRDPLKPR